MSYVMLGEELVQATCERCGFIWEFPDRYLHRKYDTELCKSCTAKPQKTVGTTRDGSLACLPWHGEVDLDTMQPLNGDGTPYRPGFRLCGHADCVRPSHIVSEAFPC